MQPPATRGPESTPLLRGRRGVTGVFHRSAGSTARRRSLGKETLEVSSRAAGARVTKWSACARFLLSVTFNRCRAPASRLLVSPRPLSRHNRTASNPVFSLLRLVDMHNPS